MSSDWPSYSDWLKSLSPAAQERAVGLTAQFRALGAEDPEMWARSEVSEDIPQLARFMVLNTIKKNALDYWLSTGVLDQAAREHAPFSKLLTQLRQSGVADAEIALFAQKIAAVTTFQVINTLDDGYDIDAADGLPGWTLEELDGNGSRTGRAVGGLHESIYAFDPTVPSQV